MSDTTLQFFDSHRPSLEAGRYRITVTQELAGQETFNKFKAEAEFTIAGPQFSLTPQDVAAVFPPPGSSGDHSNVFPHILLERSTLPWERTAEVQPDNDAREHGPWDRAPAPWLALLLFDEDDFLPPPGGTPNVLVPDDPDRPITVGRLRYPRDGDPFFLPMDPGPAARRRPHLMVMPPVKDDTLVQVIDVKGRLLKTLLPGLVAARSLVHARTSEVRGRKAERSCVVASRLPLPGKVSTVHLVSIEGRYPDPEWTGQTTKKGRVISSKEAGTDERYFRFISLHSWRFTCESHLHTFSGLLLHLNQSATVPPGEAFPAPPATPQTTLRLPPHPDPDIESRLSTGHCLLPHHFRDASRSYSWYRGPFVAGTVIAGPGLPAECADALLSYDQSTGLFFTAYATAWELGRTLCVANPRVSQALYQWKQAHRRYRHLEADATRLADLPVAVPVRPGPLPEVVSSWFNGLRQLEGVPFSCLVPDERMLPPESIRFIQLDPNWIDSLVDGAFSIGRILSSDHEHDKLLLSQPHTDPHRTAPVSGLLLRSAVVSGWPLLIVEGFGSDSTAPLDPVRTARLAPDTLLCLFDRHVTGYRIRLPDEALHFGVEPSDQSGVAPSTAPGVQAAGVTLNGRTLQFPDVPRMDPSEFAQHMILGIPSVDFGFIPSPRPDVA